MRLSGIIPESVVDGPCIRIVVFTQGCPHKCSGCHNPETWDGSGGKEFSVRETLSLIKENITPLTKGVTFSGGEPFLQAKELAEVAEALKREGLDIVVYSGFTYEELTAKNDGAVKELLAVTDILIDGKFVEELKDIELRFRGSSNQRIIDVPATQASGKVVLWGK